ncbi:MAG: dihydrolipoamide acetyltransferase family protein [Solirubrobacteraceae bacterium]
MSEIQMPRLSDSMEEGTVLKWLKAPGDAVSRGDDLVEIETDKATMTFQADAAGRLEILAQEGDTLPIGAAIARLAAEPPAGAVSPGGVQGAPPAVAVPGLPGPERPTLEPVAASVPGAVQGAPPVVAAPTAAAADGVTPDPPAAAAVPGPAVAADERIKASPIARRIAREQGLDLAEINGSGPGGRIVRADVDGRAPAAGGTVAPDPAATRTVAPDPAAASAASAKGQVTTEEPTRAQQVVARRMASSKATVPEFTLSAEVDMERCVELRRRLRAIHRDRPIASYNDIVVKACGLALREYPRANAAWRDGHFELYSRINVGVAVAGDGVLVVPTVFDADARPLEEIAAETRRLAQRVRDGQITPPELAGATFTVSNLGMFGVRSFTAVINPPQAAILAVGAVSPRPMVRDGEVVAGHAMDVTLACDHRILYGADAARFLARVRELLEEPLALLR